MIILIDGYNVLKMVFPAALVDDNQRETFIGQLARYAHMTHNNIYVIFDGGEDVRPLFLQRRDITIVYSGYRDSADSVIKGLLEEYQNKEVLLISTDRELNRYAAAYDIPSMESLVFYGYVRDRLHAGDVVRHKRTESAPTQKFADSISTAELDALMEEGSQKVFHKHDDDPAGRQQKQSPRMQSKIEKRLEKMVKKL